MTQRLTIVLLCSGPGADPSLYRPARDDVRYRHRHDAFVRCVAASLYGAAGAASGDDGSDGSNADGSSVELILLYDGDHACMRMELSHGGGAGGAPSPPMEKEVVAAWREAAKAAVRSRQTASSAMGAIDSRHRQGFTDEPRLKASCVLDAWRTVDSTKASPSTAKASDVSTSDVQSVQTKKLPAHMPSSKRETVSTLQSTCPVDYLREHRLNVPLDVALRKFNKGKLQTIWEEYIGRSCGNEASGLSARSGRESDKSGDDQWDKMERTFRSLLAEAEVDGRPSEESTNVMASYLHESCDAELPCWGWDNSSDGKSGNGSAAEVNHIYLFLGAVRDMTKPENDALSHACKKLQIPLVPCRLGPVPEFTSKIVSVAGYHFHRGVLGSGLAELWRRRRFQQNAVTAANVPPSSQKAKRTLHTIAIVPVESTSISYDPSRRNRVMWCMVRLCVCSLWRSKLASSGSSSGELLHNKLTFVFRDGAQVTLEQEDFIAALAEKHRAAPSERQILEELCSRRDSIKRSDANVKAVCREIVSASGSFDATNHEAFALDFTGLRNEGNVTRASRQIIDFAYYKALGQNAKGTGSNNMTLFAILCIRSDLEETSSSGISENIGQAHNCIRRALIDVGIAVQNQLPLLNNSSQDGEACTVILLQHLDYQGRLFQLLRDAQKYCGTTDVGDASPSRKRKRKKKDKKNKKRKQSNG